MKHLIFWLLKLLEISAVIFVPWGVGHIWKIDTVDSNTDYWFCGGVILLSGFFVFIIIGIISFTIIPEWLSANKRLVEKIYRRINDNNKRHS